MLLSSWPTDLLLIPQHSYTRFTPISNLFQTTNTKRLQNYVSCLNIETGRWSRIPPDMRLCTCSSNVVQAEEHMLLGYPISHTMRQSMLILTSQVWIIWWIAMTMQKNYAILCMVFWKCMLKLFALNSVIQLSRTLMYNYYFDKNSVIYVYLNIINK